MGEILKRLTIKDEGHYVPRLMCSINRYGQVDERDSCAEYCGDVISCENGRCAIQQCFDRLGEYEDLEAQGKLLKLPCVVGDTVRVKMQSGEYAEAEVRDYSYYLSCGFCIVVTSDKFDKQHIPFTEVGKTVFFTQEKADSTS